MTIASFIGMDLALTEDWLGKMIFIITNDTPGMSSE